MKLVKAFLGITRYSPLIMIFAGCAGDDSVHPFQPDDEIISVATEEWKRYLQEGTLSQGQVNASSAKYSKEFLQLIKGN